MSLTRYWMPWTYFMQIFFFFFKIWVLVTYTRDLDWATVAWPSIGYCIHLGNETEWRLSLSAASQIKNRSKCYIYLTYWALPLNMTFYWVPYTCMFCERRKDIEKERQADSYHPLVYSTNDPSGQYWLSWCRGSIQVHNLAGREATTWTISCCLPESILAGSWKCDTEQGITPTWDVTSQAES